MFNRKGDLAISTNAIVILIIAVIMLGLIIGFVTRGFGAVQDKFFGEIEKLPDPVKPSGANPISTSEITAVKPGEQFGMKMIFYNTGTAKAVDVTPQIVCDGDESTVDTVVSDGTSAVGDADSTVQVNPQDINPKSASQVYIYYATARDNAPTGKRLCQIQVPLFSDAGHSTPLLDADGVTPIILKRDIVLEVGK